MYPSSVTNSHSVNQARLVEPDQVSDTPVAKSLKASGNVSSLLEHVQPPSGHEFNHLDGIKNTLCGLIDLTKAIESAPPYPEQQQERLKAKHLTGRASVLYAKVLFGQSSLEQSGAELKFGPSTLARQSEGETGETHTPLDMDSAPRQPDRSMSASDQ